MPKTETYGGSKAEDLKDAPEETKPIFTSEDEELAQELRETFTNLYDYYTSGVFPSYIQAYKDKYLYAGDRAVKLKQLGLEDKSNVKFPLVDAVHDTYFANTYDAETRIIAIPMEEEDKDKTESVQAYTQRGFTQADADNIIKDVDWEALLLGPAYGRVGFESKEVRKVYQVKGKEKIYNREVNRPTLSYVDCFSLFFDTTGGDFYNKPKFWRDINHSNIVKNKYSEFLTDVSEEERKYIVSNPDPFAKENYAKIKELKGFERKITDEYCDDCDGIVRTDTNESATFTEQNVYNVDFNTQLVEVVEYREEDRFVLFINGYLVRDAESPYPFEGDPFVFMRHGRSPGSMHPRGVAQKLESLQKNVDAFVNDWIDIINATANPSFIADKGVFGQDTEQIMQLRPRWVYERMPNKVIDTIKLADPAAVNTLLNGIQFFIQQAYEIVGLNSYTQGGEGKIERTARGATQRVDVLKTALIPFLRNRNYMLSKIGERWLAMGITIMPDEFTIRLLGREDSVEFKKIRLEDLLGRFDFSFDNNALKTYELQERRGGIIEALQYIQNPDTRVVLEKKLLETFDVNVASLDDKKESIKEAVELEKYKQEQMQEAGVGQQQQQSQGGGQPQGAGGEAIPMETELSQVPAELEGPAERERQVIQQ